MPSTISKKKKRAKRPSAKKNAGRANPARAVWRLRSSHGIKILESPALVRFNWLVHGFSTRPGGESVIPETAEGKKSGKPALNLGFAEWDERERVIANRKRFYEALGAARMTWVTLRQIHSDIVVTVDAASMASMDHPMKGDALITRDPGLLLTVQTADCIPILLADTRRHAVAAIHSGWRGTVQRISEKTLGRMRMEFGTCPEDIVAAIGPGIGRCCYEVGHQVVAEFAAKFPAARDWFEGPFEALSGSDSDPNWLPWLTMRPPGHAPSPPRAMLDLFAANCAILEAAGVPPANISISKFCTATRTDLFFSYRRERTTGRLMAAIGIKK